MGGGGSIVLLVPLSSTIVLDGLFWFVEGMHVRSCSRVALPAAQRKTLRRP